MMKLRIRRLAISLAVSLVVASALAPAASAANNFGTPMQITGVCYENGAWFQSSNIRTRSAGANSSRVQFSRTPQYGVAFYVKDYNTGIAHGAVYSPPLNTWLNLALGDAPQQFVNVFRLQNAGKQSNYDFQGSESY
jgi:hypothetical protein